MTASFQLNEEIKAYIAKQKPEGFEFTSPQKVLQVHNGILYFWSHLNSSIITYSFSNKEIVTLLVSNTPIFEVEHLLVSNSGRFLSLSGKEGVSLVELPSRLYKKGRFVKREDEDEEIVCRSFPIAPKFFLLNSKILVQKVAFHPGSLYDNHVVILTTDNCLRIFNVDENPQKAEQTITFTKEGSPGSKTFGKFGLTLKAAIGETSVDFTFGPPSSSEGRGDSDTAIVQNLWPIFVLNGNGSVHCLLTGVEAQPRYIPKVIGILPMYPDAEDNYGFESCSILCLHPTISSPPVLAIATNGGILYHCVVLYQDSDDDEADDKSTTSDWSSSAFGRVELKEPDLSLYVFESVELELSLDAQNQSTDLTDKPFDYSMLLHPDPMSPARYFCSHKAGIHSLKVPMVSQLAEMTLKDDGGTDMDEKSSYVEHLICTQMAREIKPAPILGVAVSFPPASLIFLSSDFNIQCLELSLPYFVEPKPFKISDNATPQTTREKSLNLETFDMRIAELLQKSATLPRLKTKQGVETTNETNLKVFSKSLSILRSEYMARLEKAKIEIERKKNQLIQMKQHQLSQLDKLEQERINLRENATKISENYEDIKDNLENLNKRVHLVIEHLKNQDPSNSDAQLIFERHIKGLQQKLKSMKNAYETILSKERFQFRQILQDRQTISPVGKLPSSSEKITKDHLSSIKKMLEKDTAAISEVVQELKDARKAVGLVS